LANGVGLLAGMSRAAVLPNGRVLRHPGELQWLERRGMQAADRFEKARRKPKLPPAEGVGADRNLLVQALAR
jgi:hypothetical protein